MLGQEGCCTFWIVASHFICISGLVKGFIGPAEASISFPVPPSSLSYTLVRSLKSSPAANTEERPVLAPLKGAEEKRGVRMDHGGRLSSRISLWVGCVCHGASCFGEGGLRSSLEQQESKWQGHIFHCFPPHDLLFYSSFGKVSASDLAPGGIIQINLPYPCFKNSKIYQFIVILESTVTFLLLLNTLFLLKNVTHDGFWRRWI